MEEVGPHGHPTLKKRLAFRATGAPRVLAYGHSTRLLECGRVRRKRVRGGALLKASTGGLGTEGSALLSYIHSTTL